MRRFFRVVVIEDARALLAQLQALQLIQIVLEAATENFFVEESTWLLLHISCRLHSRPLRIILCRRFLDLESGMDCSRWRQIGILFHCPAAIVGHF